MSRASTARTTPRGDTAPEVTDAPDTSENNAELVDERLGLVEATQLTGISTRTLQRRIAEGQFPDAKRDMRGPGHPWRLSRSVVLEVGQRRCSSRQERVDIEGELAAAAFKLFEDAVDVVQVVIRLKAQPEAIFKLHAQWLTARAMAPTAATPATPTKPVKEIDWSTVVPPPEVK